MEHYNTVIDHNMKKDLSKIFMMNLIFYYRYKAENKYQYIYDLLILLLAYNHL